MNAETQRFEAVENTAYVPPAPARRSRALPAIVAIAVFLLAAAIVLVAGQFLYGSGAVTVEATPTTETSPEPEATDEVAQTPTDEVAEAPSTPADGHEGPSSDPLPPEPAPEPAPEPEPEPEPTVYAHPLEGTLWDVVVLSDGVGGMYDIHPDHPHQIEFDGGYVYTKGLNSGSAEFFITGNEYGWGSGLHVGMLMTTMMGGPADAMVQDSRVNSALGNASTYEIDEHTLYIRDVNGYTLLILEIVPGC